MDHVGPTGPTQFGPAQIQKTALDGSSLCWGTYLFKSFSQKDSYLLFHKKHFGIQRMRRISYIHLKRIQHVFPFKFSSTSTRQFYLLLSAFSTLRLTRVECKQSSAVDYVSCQTQITKWTKFILMALTTISEKWKWTKQGTKSVLCLQWRV